MTFTQAIARTPGRSLVNGLSGAGLGVPDYALALAQHKAYVAALGRCDVAVEVLPPEENFPDSVFVEDAALCTPRCAVITRPGAPTRRGEAVLMAEVLPRFYEKVEQIEAPGTLDAGDVMMVGEHYYIGTSARTNDDGARQLEGILRRYDFSTSIIPLTTMLHLKTGIAYLENHTLLACGEFLDRGEFSGLDVIEVPATESYAANSIWVNGRVIMPSGNPRTCEAIRSRGYTIVELDMSEFRKLDGGVSCLSLRF